VSLGIVTQRPAELDPTILSQCNTIFSLRLTNERDQEILRAGISDAAASLLEFMPTMGAGEAITFGEGVALPTRIKFDLLPAHELPRSNTASFTTNWAKDLPDDTFLHEVVSRWRAQTYNPDSSNYSIDSAAAIETGPTPQSAAPNTQRPDPLNPQPLARPSLRRDPPGSAQPQGFIQPQPAAAPTGFGRSAPPPPPPQPKPDPNATQPSLASLIKQFRT
jgi:uncharacterized protein